MGNATQPILRRQTYHMSSYVYVGQYMQNDGARKGLASKSGVYFCKDKCVLLATTRCQPFELPGETAGMGSRGAASR